MKHCPVCHAKFKGTPECRRCKSDLTDLITLENQADYMITRAVLYLKAGDLHWARRFCTHSGNLKRTEFSEALSRFLKSL